MVSIACGSCMKLMCHAYNWKVDLQQWSGLGQCRADGHAVYTTATVRSDRSCMGVRFACSSSFVSIRP